MEKYRPFAFTGLYDQWIDKETGEVISSFAIITTFSTSLLQMIPHHRSPVVLHSRDEECAWLDTSLDLAEVGQLLRPF